MKRDFTYIDDIVESVFRCCYKPASVDKDFDYLNPNQSNFIALYRIFNIGNSKPVELLIFIEILEDSLGVKAIKNFQPMQPVYVDSTDAKTNLVESWIGIKPSISIESCIDMFATWHLDYYNKLILIIVKFIF